MIIGSVFSGEQTVWLNRRATEISRERAWPLPIALSEAMAEIVRRDFQDLDELIAMPCTCSPVPYPSWKHGTTCTRCHALRQIEPPVPVFRQARCLNRLPAPQKSAQCVFVRIPGATYQYQRVRARTSASAPPGVGQIPPATRVSSDRSGA